MHLIAFLNNIYFNISVYQICMAQTYTFKIKPCVLVVQTHTFKPNPHTGGTPATIELKNKSLCWSYKQPLFNSILMLVV